MMMSHRLNVRRLRPAEALLVTMTMVPLAATQPAENANPLLMTKEVPVPAKVLRMRSPLQQTATQTLPRTRMKALTMPPMIMNLQTMETLLTKKERREILRKVPRAMVLEVRRRDFPFS
jgi:hypothetical protein